MLYLYDFSEEQQQTINAVFNAFCAHFNIKNKVNAELSAVSREEIKEINAANRGVDAVTDVLSFPNNDKIEFPLDLRKYRMDINPENHCLDLGCAVLCIEKVAEQAEEYGNTFERELSYLSVHAFLHLIGFDHVTEELKAVMRSKEEAILAEVK